MRRIARIQAEHQDNLQQALNRFGDHEDMNEGRILNWLEQFSEADLPLAFRVIERTRYYNVTNIRNMTRQLFQLASEELRRQALAKAAFIAVGDPGSGSGVVARALRDVIRGTPYKLISMLDLGHVRPGELDAVVFIDDFSGTGRTLEKWWGTVEALVRPTDATVFIGLLVLNHLARPRLEAFAELVVVDELDITKNVLGPDNREFSATHKAMLRKYCRDTGADSDYVEGFGGCGLLLAFRHGCPNNSLPLLWHDSPRRRGRTGWKSLFNRRAL